jgi:hydroxyethylthiazole kinase-like uncharacterized protein yjeF
MEILTAKQIYEVDRATIKNQEITSLDLMERAGTVCFNWIHSRLKGNPIKIHVFCGIGNNGGDGLVIARHLHQHGYNVNCYIVNFSKKRTEGFLKNFDRLKDAGVWPTMINSENEFPEISPTDVVIDAILGMGITRKVTGFTVDLLKYINSVKAYTLSIDIPSGLFADKSFSKECTILEASHTLTFQRPKIAFLLPENEPYIYTWEAINVGFDENYIAEMEVNSFTIEKEGILPIYKPRTKYSHKGIYGHSLIIGGSYGKIGSVTLASKAALTSGSGLVTSYIPKCGYDIVQTAIPEVMVEVDAEKELEFFNFKSSPTVIGVGVGIGTSEKTKKGFEKFLKSNKLPLVVDADAINIISENKDLLKLLPEDSVLTPHPLEFERLVGKWKNDHDKLKKLKAFTIENKVIVVLKGAHTVISQQGQLYFNTSGNPALATAGSGDVLTGIVTGLIAQSYLPMQASIMGVYLHGKTSNLAMKDMSVESFTASTIIEYLGKAFMSLFIDETPKPKPKKPSAKSSTDENAEEYV